MITKSDIQCFGSACHRLVLESIMECLELEIKYLPSTSVIT